MYRIESKKSVTRDLRKMGKPQVRTISAKIESELGKTPENHPVLGGKFAGLRELRVGDYRVIFSILADSVWILRVNHRKETYR